MNIIHKSFKHGRNFKIGHFCIIQEDVVVGDDVELQNYVMLKKGTRIGNGCYIDSYVLTSGNCTIGNNVTIRYKSIIARNTIIEDDVYLTAGVKTVYLNHYKQSVAEPVVIGKGCFLGDDVVVLAGVRIAPNCVIGAQSLVNKDTKRNGIYWGSPAKRMKEMFGVDIPQESFEGMY